MRRDYFFVGLGMRLLMLFLIIINKDESFNDGSEIIFYAFQNLFSGENPYSCEYILDWGESAFSQPFNYGPVTLILLLPAMLLPFWYRNLWIGMAIVINIYSFLIAEYVSKIGSKDRRLQKKANFSIADKDPRENRILYYGGLFFWMIPVGTTCITVFIYAPIFLTVLAFDKINKPFLSGFLISMAAMSYQLIYLFIPVYVIYHIKRDWKDFGKFIMGFIPALLIMGIFIIWPPGGVIESLFLYTSDMPYNKCPECNNSFDKFSVFSIPRLLYNFSGGTIQIGPFARLVMFAILGVFCAVYLFSNKFDDFEEYFIIKYSIWAVVLFTLSTNYGQAHYFIFLFIPLLYYYQMKKPDFYKKTPIGAGIWEWDDFNKYIEKFNKLPQ